MFSFVPKLVRDKVAYRIRRDGFAPRVTRVRKQAFGRYLIMKMAEEVGELHEAHVREDAPGRLAEAADLAESFAAYRKEAGISFFSLWFARLRKRRTHGAFKERLVLLSDPYPKKEEEEI